MKKKERIAFLEKSLKDVIDMFSLVHVHYRKTNDCSVCDVVNPARDYLYPVVDSVNPCARCGAYNDIGGDICSYCYDEIWEEGERESKEFEPIAT